MLWTTLAIALFSDAGIPSLNFVCAVAFATAWMGIWLTRVILFQLKLRKSVCQTATQTVVFWSFEPVVLVVVALLAYCNVLMFARFAISLPAINQYVNGVRAGSVTVDFEFSHEVRWIALYSITMTDKLPNGGVRFITSTDGLFDRAGFATFPAGKPLVVEGDSYTHIVGSWWRWEEYF